MNTSPAPAPTPNAPLDQFQTAFCQDDNRAIRLLAPAGSGKTHSLLWRCDFLAQASSSTQRFLLFTFTRAARDELRDRVRTTPEFAPIAQNVEIQTLNAWGYRRLKAKAHNLKIIDKKGDKYFTVHNLLKPVWEQHGWVKQALTSNASRHKAANSLIDVIDRLKTLGFRHDWSGGASQFGKHLDWLEKSGLGAHVQALLTDLHDIEIIDSQAGSQAVQEMMADFLPFWTDACKALRGMDYITIEDQKYWALLDIEEQLAAGRVSTGIHRVHHILVDEFQDINALDLRLLSTIAKFNKADLTVIGDDDQAIYEWRGAAPQFIIDPDKHIASGYKTHILERNYRCPKNIVDLSQKLIAHNRNRVAKKVRAVSKQVAKIEVVREPDLAATVTYVIDLVKGLLNSSTVKNVALIGRKRSQIIPYQISFAREKIPFYAAEDLHVLLSSAFVDLKEMISIKMRAPHGRMSGADPVSDLMKLLDKARRYPLARQDRANLERHLRGVRPNSIEGALTTLRNYTGSIKGDTTGGTANRMADSVDAYLFEDTVAGTLNAISANFGGLQRDYGKSVDDIFYTDPPFFYLAEFAAAYGRNYMKFIDDIEDAIATLAKISPDDEENVNPDKPWKLPLHLMTALRAKGKEFDVVIILDANEDVWPNKLATSAAQLEQERRVFYVAMTRAKQRLVFVVNDRMAGRAAHPSPYLGEMGL